MQSSDDVLAIIVELYRSNAKLFTALNAANEEISKLTKIIAMQDEELKKGPMLPLEVPHVNGGMH
jgi:hypothetical protein